jgi:CMP-N-acetylneuraminic acid synthetase
MRLAIIPARGGSKGLQGKNIRYIAGKPLIAWSIESALTSSLIDKVVVSTDDKKIAEVALQYGAEVLSRPTALATDESTTISVLMHVANEIPEADVFIVLQPTSPLRNKTLVDRCIKEFESGGYTNLASGFWCKSREFGTHHNQRRQDYKGFFYDDGSVYILNRSLVQAGAWFGDRICRFQTERYENYEIDDEVDLVIVEGLIKFYGYKM